MQAVERAVVLVAGRGRRLGRLTEDRPKCMLQVGGAPILGRILDRLAECGTQRVTLVVGYRPEDVRNFAGTAYSGMSIEYVYNERHSETNTAFSLWLARESLRSDVLILEGDIVFEVDALRRILDAAAGTSVWAAVPLSPGYDEGILLAAGETGRIRDVGLVREPGVGAKRFAFKCAGIQLLSSDLARAFREALSSAIQDGATNAFADVVLAGSLTEHPMQLCSLAGCRWSEVDDIGDLRIARRLFNGRRSLSTARVEDASI